MKHDGSHEPATMVMYGQQRTHTWQLLGVPVQWAFSTALFFQHKKLISREQNRLDKSPSTRGIENTPARFHHTRFLAVGGDSDSQLSIESCIHRIDCGDRKYHK